jgi:hypothetical protein
MTGLILKKLNSLFEKKPWSFDHGFFVSVYGALESASSV